MPKPWRLTRQAERSLVEIARWTLESFGPRQAEAYEADFIARCAALAAGEAPSQDCRRRIDPDLPEDLRVTRAGQHVIVLVEMPDQVTLVDALHSRSDLPRRLAAMAPPKDPEHH
jgi:plasmid stabilization system protein ParE